MAPTLATIAEHFRMGLIAGVCTPDEAHAWALSVIATMDDPPGEIIEVSWHKPLEGLLADLASVQGEADRLSAAYWLLARLRELQTTSGAEIAVRLRQAMQIVKHAGLSEALYYEFDALDDDLQLTLDGILGDVEVCREELKAILARFPVAPFDYR